MTGSGGVADGVVQEGPHCPACKKTGAAVGDGSEPCVCPHCGHKWTAGSKKNVIVGGDACESFEMKLNKAIFG